MAPPLPSRPPPPRRRRRAGQARTRPHGFSHAGAVRTMRPQQISDTQDPSGSGRKGIQALLVLRAGRIQIRFRSGPRKWGPGGNEYERGALILSFPLAAFWLLCRRGQSNPPPAGGGTPPNLPEKSRAAAQRAAVIVVEAELIGNTPAGPPALGPSPPGRRRGPRPRPHTRWRAPI